MSISNPSSRRAGHLITRWICRATIGLGLALHLGVQGLGDRPALAVAHVVNGSLSSIEVTDPGDGYSEVPSVTISGGGGRGAIALASLSNGGVGAISLVAIGVGYTNAPDVVITPPGLLSGGVVGLAMIPELTIYGEIGTTQQVQYANAMGNTNVWLLLTNLVLSSSPQVFRDTISPPGSSRFYRVTVPRPATPPGFKWVPAGRFTMGSPVSEADRVEDEGPQTIVTLSRGFFMGVHEVTQAEFEHVTGRNPSTFSGDPNRPVETVSWLEAQNYCAALTSMERLAGTLPMGWEYRLPTEVEWEYAARAGRTSRFSFGDDPGYVKLEEYAWFGANSGGSPHAVGSRKPNGWGFCDMSGNVWEW